MSALREARPEELDAVYGLWTEVFGDGEAVQREFYRLCLPGGPLTLWEDGALCAMVALPRLTLTSAAGERVEAGYIYALATAPEARGRGCAARLLEHAAGLGKEQGLSCLITVPAQPSLFRFFARCGYEPAFWNRRFSARPAAVPAAAVTPGEYGALRESLLAGRCHVTYPEGLLAFQQILCPGEGSGLYRLELPHGPGCAAVERWGEIRVVKELLCHAEDEQAAAAGAAALCGGEAEIRCPPGESGATPFGAVRWLVEPPFPAEGYLGLAMD